MHSAMALCRLQKYAHIILSEDEQKIIKEQHDRMMGNMGTKEIKALQKAVSAYMRNSHETI